MDTTGLESEFNMKWGTTLYEKQQVFKTSQSPVKLENIDIWSTCSNVVWSWFADKLEKLESAHAEQIKEAKVEILQVAWQREYDHLFSSIVNAKKGLIIHAASLELIEQQVKELQRHQADKSEAVTDTFDVAQSKLRKRVDSNKLERTKVNRPVK